MQKFLIALLTPIIEKVFKRAFNFIISEINQVKQVQKDRKLLKDLRKVNDSRERAKRIKHYLDN